jgi:hypothetical protein
LSSEAVIRDVLGQRLLHPGFALRNVSAERLRIAVHHQNRQKEKGLRQLFYAVLQFSGRLNDFIHVLLLS